MLWVFPLPIMITLLFRQMNLHSAIQKCKALLNPNHILQTMNLHTISKDKKVFWTIIITFKPWISIIFKRYKCLSLIITFFKQWMFIPLQEMLAFFNLVHIRQTLNLHIAFVICNHVLQTMDLCSPSINESIFQS
jgi:hypothetical protein